MCMFWLLALHSQRAVGLDAQPLVHAAAMIEVAAVQALESIPSSKVREADGAGVADQWVGGGACHKGHLCELCL